MNCVLLYIVGIKPYCWALYVSILEAVAGIRQTGDCVAGVCCLAPPLPASPHACRAVCPVMCDAAPATRCPSPHTL